MSSKFFYSVRTDWSMTGIYARTASLAIFVHLYQTPKAVAHGCFCVYLQVTPSATWNHKGSAFEALWSCAGTIVRSHMETGENMQKIIFFFTTVFPQPRRFIRKCSLAPCARLLGSTKRIHPNRSDCCSDLAKIELFWPIFASTIQCKKSDFSDFGQKSSADQSKKPSADPKITFTASPHIP